MKTEIKQKWLNALRSGEYKQGIGALRKATEDENGKYDDKEYCCLGVLCDILEPKKWKVSDNGYGVKEWGNGNEAEPTAFPREKLMEELGLNKVVSRSSDDTIAQKLAFMNDEGKTFTQIANWIEKKDF
jgi:hypothetical protein